MTNAGETGAASARGERSAPDNNETESAGEGGMSSVDSGSSSASEDILPAHMAATDLRRMLLINEEAWCALDIKIAIEQTPGVDNLSDFMYAQLAIICKNDVEDAILRAKAMQHFRDDYCIVETHERGCFALKQLLESHPGMFLSFRFDPESSAYILALDLAKCNAAVLASTTGAEKWMTGMYYMLHALCPDLESIRKGVTGIVKWEGIDATGAKKPQDWGQITDGMTPLASAYPCSGKLLHYHSNPEFVAMATSMWKKTLPKEFWTRFILESTTSDTFLESLFSAPSGAGASNGTAEGVNNDQRLLEETLRLRYENVGTFTLSRNSYNLQREQN